MDKAAVKPPVNPDRPKPRGRNGGRKPKLGVRLDHRIELSMHGDLYGLLSSFAAERGITLQDLCREVLGEYVAHRLIV